MDRWEARTTDLHLEEVEDSVVIYDARDDSVHYLTDDTLLVYNACPGSIDDIAERTGLPEDHVAAHLAELESRALVLIHTSSVSRKTVIASALAVIGIWSMSAPTPAAASSTTSGGDTGGGGGVVVPATMYYFTTNGGLFSANNQGIIIKTPVAPYTGYPLSAGNYEYYGSYTGVIGMYWELTLDTFPKTIFQDAADKAWVDYYRTNNLKLPQIYYSNYPNYP